MREIKIDGIGNVVLVQNNIDVDLLADIARTCKHGDNVPQATQEQNDKFIKGLYLARHLSIFEFGDVLFKVTVPIYVARQLMRYRTGKYCEKSLRATQPARRLSEKSVIDVHYNACYDFYKALINQGYKREEARRVLPLDTTTVYYFKIDLRNLLHLIEERTAPGAQSETRKIVEGMKTLLLDANPRLQGLFD